MSLPLELDGPGLRRLLDEVGRRLGHFLDTLATQPAVESAGRDRLATALREPLPEEGRSVGSVMALIFERIVPIALHTAGGGYLGYIPGGGLPHSGVADLIADVTNRYVGLWQAAPGLVELESAVIRWLAQELGMGPQAGGLLTTGGSMANFTAIVTARRERLPENFLGGRIYTSVETHHSVKKAAILAGFPERAVRVLPVDAERRLREDALSAAILEDRAAGLSPFLLVSTAGSTPTGAVDDLQSLGALCAAEGLWHHVDGAYGGAFCLTARGKAALAGIGAADSVALDPHKGLFLPYGTGALLVRDPEALRRAHALTASYLPPMETDPRRWDFAELGPELSRDARGLRLWLPLMLCGARAFREALDEKLDLARVAHAEIAAWPGVRCISAPALSLFAFRMEGVDDPNVWNRSWLLRANAGRRVFLTGVEVDGLFTLRLCVLSFRTHAAQVGLAIEALAEAAASLGRPVRDGPPADPPLV